MDTTIGKLDDESGAVRWFRSLFHDPPLQDRHTPDYDALKSFLVLASSSQEEVLLRFCAIEHLIGCSLPAAALHDRLWWSNIASAGEMKHTRAWLHAGCVVTAVQSDPATGWVRFRRVAGAEEPAWMRVFTASLSDDEQRGWRRSVSFRLEGLFG